MGADWMLRPGSAATRARNCLAPRCRAPNRGWERRSERGLNPCVGIIRNMEIPSRVRQVARAGREHAGTLQHAGCTTQYTKGSPDGCIMPDLAYSLLEIAGIYSVRGDSTRYTWRSSPAAVRSATLPVLGDLVVVGPFEGALQPAICTKRLSPSG